MTDDDDFEPRLGKPRTTPIRRGKSYMSQVLHAANLAGGIKALGGRRGRFYGNRSGVGVGVGRVLASRDRFAAYRQRRVMVKYRIAGLRKPKAMDGARAHLRYIQRDGVTREGEPGRLYSADQDKADGKAFLEKCDGDRHQFRFIVSPEDGQHYDDLKSLMLGYQAQLGAPCLILAAGFGASNVWQSMQTTSAMQVVHRPAKVGRISMMVVEEGLRGRGIGRALVAAAQVYLRETGCYMVEVTSRFERTQAHGFYEALGFAKTSVRLARNLEP